MELWSKTWCQRLRNWNIKHFWRVDFWRKKWFKTTGTTSCSICCDHRNIMYNHWWTPRDPIHRVTDHRQSIHHTPDHRHIPYVTLHITTTSRTPYFRLQWDLICQTSGGIMFHLLRPPWHPIRPSMITTTFSTNHRDIPYTIFQNTATSHTTHSRPPQIPIHQISDPVISHMSHSRPL